MKKIFEDERQRDVREIATRMLPIIKAYDGGSTASNDTPEGRMIHQLEWILSEQDADRLKIPIDGRLISTLRHQTFEYGDIIFPQKDAIKLLAILWNGNYLMKPEYYSIPIKIIDKLMGIIYKNYPSVYNCILEKKSTRKYDREKKEIDAMIAHGEAAPEKQGARVFPLLNELQTMMDDWELNNIEPPLNMSEIERRYPAFLLIYRFKIFRESMPALYKEACQLEDTLISGIRPGPDGKVVSFNSKYWEK